MADDVLKLLSNMLPEEVGTKAIVLPVPSTGSQTRDHALGRAVYVAVNRGKESKDKVAVEMVHVPSTFDGGYTLQDLFRPTKLAQEVSVTRRPAKLSMTAHNKFVVDMARQSARLVHASRATLTALCTWVYSVILDTLKLEKSIAAHVDKLELSAFQAAAVTTVSSTTYNRVIPEWFDEAKFHPSWDPEHPPTNFAWCKRFLRGHAIDVTNNNVSGGHATDGDAPMRVDGILTHDMISTVVRRVEEPARVEWLHVSLDASVLFHAAEAVNLPGKLSGMGADTDTGSVALTKLLCEVDDSTRFRAEVEVCVCD